MKQGLENIRVVVQNAVTFQEPLLVGDQKIDDIAKYIYNKVKPDWVKEKEEKEKQPTGRKGLSCTVICILRKKKINIASSNNAKRKKEKHVEIRRLRGFF